ncbi:MAG: flavin reductase family protein [Bryobacteraceae bacterium]
MSSNPRERPRRGVNPQEFRRACGRFATGVAVASVFDPGGEPHGITVNSFSSISLEPPLVLIAVGLSAGILKHFHAAPRFALNILREDQEYLSVHFARKGRDRFESVPCREVRGVPLIPGVLAALECETSEIHRAGDHDLLIALVTAAEIHRGRPLLYFASAYGSMG